ncbi:MAG: LamG domain-containing protein [Candidatus Aenigmatarchaeota archaeon]
MLLILSLIFLKVSKALTCSIKSSCDANEQCIFSTYQANDTHAGNCSAYTNKYCCSDPFLTSASVKEFCGIGEFSILAFYNYTDAHAETFNNFVLELRFEENFGDLTFDSSGKGNHGKIYGASWTDGKFGKALSFDGEDDWVKIGDVLGFTSGDFTIVAWIKTSSGAPDNEIVAKGGSCAVGGYKLITYNGYLRGSFNNQSANPYYEIVSNIMLNDSQWHQVAFVVKGLKTNSTYAYLFIDGNQAEIQYGKINPAGTLVGNGPFDTSEWNISTPCSLGIGSSDRTDPNACPYYFNGTIDEVRIYNRALTEEEIKALYYQQRVCVSCPWSCEVKNSCSAGEFNITSVYQLTNTHLADPTYYNLKLCCKREDLAPLYSSQSQNNSNPTWGEAVLLSVYWKDNGNLSYAILATNETGTWENKTTYGSPLQLNHFQKWSNFTWQNSSLPPTTIVAWKVYANDSCGNWNVSDTFTFKIREPNPPFYSLNSTNSTIAGTAVMHSLFWQDDVGLSYAIFSFDNCTGEFQNISEMSLSGVSAWSNFTVIINETIGCTIRWCVYANDTSNNWNATSCENPFSYVTIPYIISAELSPKLSEGIFFTNRTGAEINQQFPIHIDWNNATWNYNASNKKTEYWVNNTGTVAFDLCFKANSHLTCSSGSCAGLTIDISNVAWNNSTLTDENNPSFDTSKRLSLNYQKVAFNVAPSQLIYFRFWVNVPFGQPSGIYNSTFSVKAVDVGISC